MKCGAKSSIQLDMDPFPECAYFLFEASMACIDVGYDAYVVEAHGVVGIWSEG